MAEKFFAHIKTLEESDPIFLSLPKYANKKKLKDVQRDLEAKQKSTEQYSDVKNVKLLLNVLEEKVESVKSISTKFQNEYNSAANLKKECDSMKDELAKEQSDLNNISKLEQDLMNKRQSTIDAINKRHDQVNQDFNKFVEELQEKLKYSNQQLTKFLGGEGKGKNHR